MGLHNLLRREPLIGGECEQGRFAFHQMLQNAGEKLRFGGGGTQGFWANSGNGQKATKRFWVTGDVQKPLNGDFLRMFLRHLTI